MQRMLCINVALFTGFVPGSWKLCVCMCMHIVICDVRFGPTCMYVCMYVWTCLPCCLQCVIILFCKGTWCPRWSLLLCRLFCLSCREDIRIRPPLSLSTSRPRVTHRTQIVFCSHHSHILSAHFPISDKTNCFMKNLFNCPKPTKVKGDYFVFKISRDVVFVFTP